MRSNMKVIQGFLILTIAIGFSLQAKDRGVLKTKPVHKQLGIIESSNNLRILGSSVDYDIIRAQDDAMPARGSYRTNRNTADTLAYVPADGGWNGQFIQSPGDAMMVMFKMPADGIIKAVNVLFTNGGLVNRK